MSERNINSTQVLFLPKQCSSERLFLVQVIVAAAFFGLLTLSARAASPAGSKSILQWEHFDDFRRAKLSVPAQGKTGFTLMPSAVTGISFTNWLPMERAMTNQNLLNGSGVALGDYDGDGLCDIYLCNLDGTNALYKNLGNWKFKDVTLEAGVACPNQTSTGAVFADLNGDGFLDLLVTSMGGPNACFLNDGQGHFTNVTVAAGLSSKLGSTSMALADIDGNGTLDLYVANYGVNSIIRTGGALSFNYVNGKPVVRGRYSHRIKIIDGVMFELGEPDVLYLNDGKGKFTPVSWTDGTFVDEEGRPLTEAPWDQGLTAVFHDMNGDGYPDLYVCNDASTPDRCWINDGHGRFRALNHLAWRSTSYFSMSIGFADIDRDGRDDFLVLDMLSRQHRLALTQKSIMHTQPSYPGDIDTQFQIRRNTLFHNRGDGTYAEIANYAGLTASEWSWSCVFLDVDLDGWEDVLIGNGFSHDVDDMDTKERIKQMGKMSIEDSRRTMFLFPPLDTPDLAFRNQHDLTFSERSEWGFNSKQISNGMALADLDNDGDLDLVVNCLNGEALIYRNDTTAPRMAVRLKGKAPNTHAIGARIKVTGGPVTQSLEMQCGGRYMSGDDTERVFATGDSTNLAIEVTWRSGAQTVVRHCEPNYIYEIDETTAAPGQHPEPAAAQKQPTLFSDVSDLLQHKHHQEQFDDFARQPLLPKRLSQLGPGVAWVDLDGDGRDDLIVADGKGGRLAVFRNESEKGFQRLDSAEFSQTVGRDETTVLSWQPEPGTISVLVGAANYVDATTNQAAVLRYDFRNGAAKTLSGLPAQVASIGPMALGELTGGESMALFVGGRVIPGRYPQAASSLIYQYDGKQWELDQTNSAQLANVGMISSAVWSDLDGDGFPELILACEWGPIRIFHNDRGLLKQWTLPLTGTNISPQVATIDLLTGWWTGVTAADLDGDGRMDIIAGNWGLNSPYHASAEHPVRLYYGDWNESGGVDLLEAEDDPELGVVPRRDLGAVGAGLPFLWAKFPTYLAFAETNVAGILGDKMNRTRELQANTLASVILLNRGDHFEAVPMPAEAQFAPAFAVCVGDADGDGNEDVFLSQNFFDNNADVPCLDGGRGLWLRGDGTGKLTALPGQESGVKIYGEQRGAALCDYDGDGRLDLVVTQNGAQTRLFHNSAGKPGLRVRLKGRNGNLTGIGAQIRLFFGNKAGPVREIHGGSGYWSQDSTVQVLAAPQTPDRIWVRWPGGRVTTSSIPPEAKEIEVDREGNVKALH